LPAFVKASAGITCLAPPLKLRRHAVAKAMAGKTKSSPDKPGKLWICRCI